MIFRCTAANTWVVESDGRIPCSASIYCSTAITTNTAATWKQVDFATNTTTSFDNSSMVDTTNDWFSIRRAGVYEVGFSGRPNSALAADKYFTVKTALNGGGDLSYINAYPPVSTAVQVVTTQLQERAAGDGVEWWFRPQETDKGFGASASTSYLSMQEQF